MNLHKPRILTNYMVLLRIQTADGLFSENLPSVSKLAHSSRRTYRGKPHCDLSYPPCMTLSKKYTSMKWSTMTLARRY
jgi:hypothetical protein